MQLDCFVVRCTVVVITHSGRRKNLSGVHADFKREPSFQKWPSVNKFILVICC